MRYFLPRYQGSLLSEIGGAVHPVGDRTSLICPWSGDGPAHFSHGACTSHNKLSSRRVDQTSITMDIVRFSPLDQDKQWQTKQSPCLDSLQFRRRTPCTFPSQWPRGARLSVARITEYK